MIKKKKKRNHKTYIHPHFQENQTFLTDILSDNIPITALKSLIQYPPFLNLLLLTPYPSNQSFVLLFLKYFSYISLHRSNLLPVRRANKPWNFVS